jgi:hypothetical protein
MESILFVTYTNILVSITFIPAGEIEIEVSILEEIF